MNPPIRRFRATFGGGPNSASGRRTSPNSALSAPQAKIFGNPSSVLRFSNDFERIQGNLTRSEPVAKPEIESCRPGRAHRTTRAPVQGGPRSSRAPLKLRIQATLDFHVNFALPDTCTNGHRVHNLECGHAAGGHAGADLGGRLRVAATCSWHVLGSPRP